VDNTPPEEKYKDQIVSLENMGFVDKAANINALKATNGNVEAAIERLLQKWLFDINHSVLIILSFNW